MSGFGRQFWEQHHQAWKGSGLRRIAYCEQHGLAVRNFRRWSARFEPRQSTQNDPDVELQESPAGVKGNWRDVSSVSLEAGRPAIMAQLLSARAFRRRKWTEAERQDVVWDLLQSGMPTYQYAQTHNLSRSMLYRWLKELAEPIPGPHQPATVADPPPVFAAVTIAPDNLPDTPAAQMASALPSASVPVPAGDLQIGLPNGAFLRVPVQIDPATLRGILDVLAAMR